MTNNLGRTLVAAAQGSNVFTAINDGDGVNDKAVTGVYDLLVDGTAASITADDWLNQTIRVGDDSPGATGPFTVTTPATVRGVVTIVNNLAYDVTVTISGQSATPPTILAGQSGLVSSDGVNVRQVGARAGTVYDVALSFAGTPAANEIISAFMIPRDVVFSANFAGAVGYVGSPPASTFIISVRDDDAEIGTITISNDSPAGIFTFATTSGEATTVASGSRLEFVAPGTPDASISYILATLAGIVL